MIDDKKTLNKAILAHLVKSLNLEVDSNEQDFILMTLVVKSHEFKEIPIKFFRDFLDSVFSFENNSEIKEKPKISKINEEPETKTLKTTEKIEKNEDENPFKKTKTTSSKLPPIESPKNQQKATEQKINPPKQDINKKIMNQYGKFDVIEEEKIGESLESYNDYLVKIKPKNEESFSIVAVLVILN